MKTIPVDVYKCSKYSGCSNGGISEEYKTLFLDCPDGYIEKEPNDETVLHVDFVIVGGQAYYHAEQYSAYIRKKNMVGPMMGGTFIYSSDSRFPFDYPLPLHDRFETQEEYDVYFR